MFSCLEVVCSSCNEQHELLSRQQDQLLQYTREQDSLRALLSNRNLDHGSSTEDGEEERSLVECVERLIEDSQEP